MTACSGSGGAEVCSDASADAVSSSLNLMAWAEDVTGAEREIRRRPEEHNGASCSTLSPRRALVHAARPAPAFLRRSRSIFGDETEITGG
jgi:hypothetical protein